MSRGAVTLQLSRKEYKTILAALATAEMLFTATFKAGGRASFEIESALNEEDTGEFSILTQLILNEYDEEGNAR